MRIRHNTTPYETRRSLSAGAVTGSYVTGREAESYSRLQAHQATGSRGAYADRMLALKVLALITVLLLAALAVGALT